MGGGKEKGFISMDALNEPQDCGEGAGDAYVDVGEGSGLLAGSLSSFLAEALLRIGGDGVAEERGGIAKPEMELAFD